MLGILCGEGKDEGEIFFCPGTCSVEQVGLELRVPPASASWVLRLKACPTCAQPREEELFQVFPPTAVTLSSEEFFPLRRI